MKKTEKWRYILYALTVVSVLLPLMAVTIVSDLVLPPWVELVCLDILAHLFFLGGQVLRIVELRRERSPIWVNLGICVGTAAHMITSIISA